MSAIELVAHLQSLDVKLTVEGNKLKCNAPDGVLTGDLLASLKEHKQEVIEFLSAAKIDGTDNSKIPIANRNHDIPLSFAQQRLWFIHKLEDSASYNMGGCFRIKGDLDLEKIRLSLEQIVHRHEILRTRFAESDGEAVQIIEEPGSFRLAVEDISYLTSVVKEEEIDKQIKDEGNTHFDLEHDALFRAKVIKCGGQRFVLLINMHHIISDGWSVGILINELTENYKSLITGKPVELDDLDIQYADFSQWQRQHLVGKKFDVMLDYWRDRLQDLPSLEFPTDYPRHRIQTARGSKHLFELSSSLADKLDSTSKQLNTTLFVVLLSAYKIVLQRYTGKTDLCVGVPSANRNHHDIEPLIGFFVNSLAIRSQASAQLTVQEYIASLHEAMAEAGEYQALPFDKLVDDFGLKRDLSQSPIFQTMFNLQNMVQGDALSLPNVEMEFSPIETDTAKFDLALTFFDTSDGLTAEFEYNRDLFKPSTMERLGRHVVAVLEQITDNIDAKLDAIKLLSAEEEELILRTWNNTQVDYPSESVIDLFKRNADEAPQSLAIRDDNRSLDYQQLDQESDRLAAYLMQQNIGEGDYIAIYLPRSVEMIIAELACLKIGAAYVPIDTHYPNQRVSSILKDSNPRAVITLEALRDAVEDGSSTLILYDDLEQPLNEIDIDVPALKYDSKRVAYIIYTSGSAGIPKGVLIGHGSLTNLCLWSAERFELQASSKAAQIASAGFDAVIWELWPSLAAGSSITIMDDDTRMSAAETIRWLAEREITHCLLTTPLAESVLDEPLPKNWALEYLLTGGDKLTRSVTKPESFNFVNAYGPTEACVIASLGPNLMPDEESVPSIGTPHRNGQCYVLDENMAPVPIGVVGELYIGGAGVALGYLNREELTQEKFIENPFGEGRLYRSGDLVRYKDNAELDYIGRIDFQVQIRGFRIELGEIEIALNKFDEVHEAVVRVFNDGNNEKYIAAYLVASKKSGIKIDALKRELKQRLPDYMVPTAFAVLDKMPLSPSGKYDRAGLEKISPQVGVSGQRALPRDEIEEQISLIWRKTLKIDEVGIYDDFFEVGGHSLLATKVIARIKDQFDVELPLKALFEGLTIAAIAEAIVNSETEVQGSAIPKLEAYPHQGPQNISHAQQRLWILNQLESGDSFYNISSAYNITAGLRLFGALNVEALNWSFQEVVNRHEVLRTTFYSEKGLVYQRILAKSDWELVSEDLTHLSKYDQQAAIRNIGIRESTRAFDLEEGPYARRTRLLRVILVKLSEQEHALFVAMHHIISDGWSIKILVKEVSCLYGARIQGHASPLPELNIQYRDYVVWQKKFLQGDYLASQLQYWEAQLAELNTLQLPYDYPRPPIQTYKGTDFNFILEDTLVERLSELGREQGATLFMVLLAAFKVLLSRYSRQEDICVGIPVANRSDKAVEPLIGFFVNTLALRTDLSGKPSFLELLEREQRVTIGALDHQNVPFEKLVEVLKIDRHLSHSPLFQVMFSLNSEEFGGVPEFPDLEVEVLNPEIQTAQFDLSLHLLHRGGKIEARFDYNTDLFKLVTVRRMADHFNNLLESILATPNRAVDELNIISSGERHKLTVEWNNTAKRFPKYHSVHQLFEQQVDQTPHGEALVFEGESLTYLELDQRANQLAHYLCEKGIVEEDLVAVCLPRSVDLVVALYGIIKAGAAYVPLDPSLPRDRLSYILDNTRAPVVLTIDSLQDSFSHGYGKVLCVDNDKINIAEFPVERLSLDVSAANLMYVIYTSGSTGMPKGVANEHKGVINRLLWMQDQYLLNNTDRVLQKTPFSFDVSVWEFFWPLFTGATLVLAKPDGHKDPNYINRIIRQENISTLHFVPSMLAVFLQQGDAKACQTLKRVFCSGEALSVDLQNQFFQHLNIPLHNLYGPTEAAVDVSHWTCRQTSMQVCVPIGRPISNVKLYVLDQCMNPVPVGVPGELYIGGIALAREYLGNETLTAKSFIEHEVVENCPERLYKTGDLVKYLNDGNIEYLGRLDYQVKLRGLRIELGEIESCIKHSQDIDDCVVLLQGEDVEQRIVAYIVHNATELDVEHLKIGLKSSLPDYMIPSAFMVLPSIPVTANGKVDRKELLKIKVELSHQQEFVPPRNETEEILATLWGEVLQLDAIGVKDNFFDLGGHSLLATQVISRVKETFQVELSLSVLFENQTIENMAIHILEQEAKSVDMDIMAELLAELEDLDGADLEGILDDG